MTRQWIKNLATDTCLHEVGQANPEANASAQRHRGVGQDAENLLAALQATGAMTVFDSGGCPNRF